MQSFFYFYFILFCGWVWYNYAVKLIGGGFCQVDLSFIELVKTVIIGIVEGLTEWLPISSTGHMILVDEFIKLDVSKAFMDMFLVVIQLGAILAVVVLYFHKLNPFSPRKNGAQKRGTGTWAVALTRKQTTRSWMRPKSSSGSKAAGARIGP